MTFSENIIRKLIPRFGTTQIVSKLSHNFIFWITSLNSALVWTASGDLRVEGEWSDDESGWSSQENDPCQKIGGLEPDRTKVWMKADSHSVENGRS